VKSTYSRCQQYFIDSGRKTQRELQRGQICYSKVMKEIQKNQEKACSHIARIYDIQRMMFEVKEAFNPISQLGGQKWLVNLNDRRQFNLNNYRIPHLKKAMLESENQLPIEM